jgi:hypothetical protein
MAVFTLSGWPAVKPGTPNVLKTFVIPGTISAKNPTGRRLTVRRDVGPYLVSFAAEFHKRIMPLNKYTGAYNFRQARNANKLSDHAGGVAMDINWNVLAQGDIKSLTDKQYQDLLDLLNEYPGMGWGGFYGGGRRRMNPMYDPMHFFLSENGEDYYLNQMKKKGIGPNGKIKNV